MYAYWAEFLPLLVVFILAVVSPGPDFAIIIQQALLHGRRAALLGAFGIGAGILIHVGYTILGLGLIMTRSLLLFSIIKWAGVAYLVYLGFKALTSKGVSATKAAVPACLHHQRALKSFMTGFAINLLNPKAAVFFLSVFSTFVSDSTPPDIQFIYGLTVAGITTGWFSLVAFFMTTPFIRQVFTRASKWIDRLSGLVFIGFGVRLMLQKAS